MLVAVNKGNQYVNALDEQKNKKRKKDYYCPSCKKPVFLKKGLIKQAHFTHFQKNDCSIFSEGETEEHILGKKILYHWFIQQEIPCQLEAYLPNLKQRPDLLIWLDEQTPTAIEFQCSALSAERMLERTLGYTKNGYRVYWILGQNFHLKNKLTSFQRLFIQEHKKIGCYFLELHVETNDIVIHYGISQEGNSSCIISQCCHLKMDESTSLNTIIPQFMVYSKFTQIEPKKKLIQSHYFLNRGRNYQVPIIVAFQKYIYKKGDSLVSLPLEVYLPVKNQLFIKTLSYFWKYQFLEWIMERNSGEIISKKEIAKKTTTMIKNNELNFYIMPLISDESKRKCITHFITLLNKRGLLIAISHSEWIVQKEAQRYKNENEKITEFLKLDMALIVDT
ncbi:protein involved in establishment of DNA transport in competence [Carnobacterium sp. 17-4]|uniref:competence protein CoiA n=1 Tax=Carnobacterium sp. (strain 17-4) TaxID=208596 RepID=UPI00020589D8|nr:competence protein CoiA family protein [Carnobacterium sp. 17-4]AEB29447.1 protein involved in establishment of DNA transport in competence [Carnobacterium sp. 17-4]